MAGPLYIADPENSVRSVELDGLTALFHEPSGMTHIVAPPAPQILEALREGPADLEELLRRLSQSFDFQPSPFMGDGGVGVNANEGRGLSGDSTPPHGQVALSPGQGFGSRGDPNLPILPIKGRGFELDALAARLDELEIAGLVRRA